MADLGRPTVLTPEVIRKIEEIAALGGSVEEMAFFAGIHRDTIYARMKVDADFSDRLRELQETPVLRARRAVVNSLDDPDKAFKFLERKKRKEFGANVDITTEGKALPTPILPLDKYELQGNDGNKEDLGTD